MLGIFAAAKGTSTDAAQGYFPVASRCAAVSVVPMPADTPSAPIPRPFIRARQCQIDREVQGAIDRVRCQLRARLKRVVAVPEIDLMTLRPWGK